MKSPIFLLATFGLVVLGACRTSWQMDHARVDPTKPFVAERLETIVKHPRQFQEADVIFAGIFRDNEEAPFVAGYMPFEEGNHHGFAVWIPSTRIWEPEESMNGLVRTLYIAKDNPNIKKVLAARRYQPLILYGRVRSTFQDMPWIEVYDVTPQGPPVYTEQGLADFYQGVEALDRGDVEEAIRRFRAAWPDLRAPVARAEMYRLTAAALLQRGDPDSTRRAVTYLSEARRIRPKDHQIKDALDRARAMLHRLEGGEPPEQNPDAPPKSGTEGRIRELQEELSRLKEEAARKDKEIHRLQGLVGEREETAEDLRRAQGRLEELQAARKEAEKRSETLRQKLAAAESTISALRKAHAAEIEALKKQVTEIRKERDAARARTTRLEKELDALKAAGGGDASRELEAARQRIADLESAVASLQEELKKARQQVVDPAKIRKETAAQYEEEIRGLNETIQRLRETIQTQRKYIDELEGQLKKDRKDR